MPPRINPDEVNIMPVEEINSASGLHVKGEAGGRKAVRIMDGGSENGKTSESAKSDEVKLSPGGQGMAELEQTMKDLKQYNGWGNFNIDFSTDDNTGSLIIKIVDRDTGETLKQIPPEQILNLKSQLQEVLGLVFDHMA